MTHKYTLVTVIGIKCYDIMSKEKLGLNTNSLRKQTNQHMLCSLVQEHVLEFALSTGLLKTKVDACISRLPFSYRFIFVFCFAQFIFIYIYRFSAQTLNNINTQCVYDQKENDEHMSVARQVHMHSNFPLIPLVIDRQTKKQITHSLVSVY